MRATCIVVRDPFRPAHRREVTQHRRRRRIRALAPATARPIVCILNGRPILRAAWRRRVRDGDVVVFAALPGDGGGGSNPMRVVAMLALVVLAPYAAAGLHSALWSAGVMLGTAGLTALTVGVAVGGMVLVNALLPAPKPPASQQLQAIAAPSPTYSLQGQGNQARIGSPIPVIYGRHLIYPDFGAQPYVEYAGNEQYLFQLHVIGQGEHVIEALRIEDTVVQADPIADGAPHLAAGVWEDITYQIVHEAPVTLFPANVTTSSEVSGQEALYNVALGPFVAHAAGTLADHLAVDVVAPRGLFAVDAGTGALLTRSITFTTEARPIDDTGAPTGAWATLGTETLTGATTTPQRYSFRYPVSQARYEVRLTRTTDKDPGSNVGHDLLWAGLRAYHPGSANYGALTVLALRMRASNQLSQQAARRVNVIATRKLPVWDGSAWSAPQATRSPAWAIADMLRASYGAQLPDERIDLDGLLALDALWASRQDYFDAVLDSTQTVWEAVTQAARAGRAAPYRQGGIVHVVRDQAQSVPVQIYTLRNIVRGSLTLDYAMPSEDTADAVDVEYFDAEVWSWRTVRAALPDSTAAQPARVKLIGVTGREQAWREGMYIAADNRYRRRFATFSTEMEGFIPAPGDLAGISHDLPSWGQSGEVERWDADNRVMTLSEPLRWADSGTHYIGLRARDGSEDGPYEVTPGPQLNQVVLPVAPAIPIDVGGARERTHYSFGVGTTRHIRVRIAGIRPRAPERVDLSVVVESDFVHVADTGVPPGAGAWQLPTQFTVPVVEGLLVRSSKDEAAQALLTWRPAAGAERYLVEAAYGTDVADPALVYTRLGETAASHFSVRAIYGAQTVFRVAAIGATRGPWASILFGSSSDFMWTDPAALMWSVDTNLMWS